MFPLKPGKNTKSAISKPKGQTRESHTQFVKNGMGNFYGRAAKNPMGRIRDQFETVGYRPVNKKQLGTPPKSVV